MYEKHKDQAEFFLVYIREAHPDNGWQVRENERDDIRYLQPLELGQRAAIAQTCSAALNITYPVLVDDIDNTTAFNYSAWPDRLYIVTTDGTIGYKGELGPHGFNVPEMADALETMLTGSTDSSDPIAIPTAANDGASIPIL